MPAALMPSGLLVDQSPASHALVVKEYPAGSRGPSHSNSPPLTNSTTPSTCGALDSPTWRGPSRDFDDGLPMLMTTTAHDIDSQPHTRQTSAESPICPPLASSPSSATMAGVPAAAVTPVTPVTSLSLAITSALAIEERFDDIRENGILPPSLTLDVPLSSGDEAPPRGITPRPTHRHRRTLSNQVTIVADFRRGGHEREEGASAVSRTTTPHSAAPPSASFTLPPSSCPALPRSVSTDAGQPCTMRSLDFEGDEGDSVGLAARLHSQMDMCIVKSQHQLHHHPSDTSSTDSTAPNSRLMSATGSPVGRTTSTGVGNLMPPATLVLPASAINFSSPSSGLPSGASTGSSMLSLQSSSASTGSATTASASSRSASAVSTPHLFAAACTPKPQFKSYSSAMTASPVLPHSASSSFSSSSMTNKSFTTSSPSPAPLQSAAGAPIKGYGTPSPATMLPVRSESSPAVSRTTSRRASGVTGFVLHENPLLASAQTIYAEDAPGFANWRRIYEAYRSATAKATAAQAGKRYERSFFEWKWDKASSNDLPSPTLPSLVHLRDFSLDASLEPTQRPPLSVRASPLTKRMSLPTNFSMASLLAAASGSPISLPRPPAATTTAAAAETPVSSTNFAAGKPSPPIVQSSSSTSSSSATSTPPTPEDHRRALKMNLPPLMMSTSPSTSGPPSATLLPPSAMSAAYLGASGAPFLHSPSSSSSSSASSYYRTGGGGPGEVLTCLQLLSIGRGCPLLTPALEPILSSPALVPVLRSHSMVVIPHSPIADHSPNGVDPGHAEE